MCLAVMRASSWAAALLFCLPAASLALESDREQPVHISADQVELDEQKGVSHYRGNVHLDQGTLSIRADRMTVYQTRRQIDRILIHGAPAYFTQLPEAEQQPVEAEASQMTYLSNQARLELEGEARVEQDGNTFSGNRIVYDTQRSTVRASRGSDDQDRVHVIIQPEEDPSP